MLERLLHHAHIVRVTGDSDRMNGKRTAARATSMAATAATA